MDELAASREFSVDQGTGRPSSTVGNPKLDPWRATAVDLSYEKYFAKKAYVSASLFYKDLKTYIYKQTVDGVDYSQLTGSLPPNYAKVPVSPTGFLTIPLNGESSPTILVIERIAAAEHLLCLFNFGSMTHAVASIPAGKWRAVESVGGAGLWTLPAMSGLIAQRL
jgi:hypothetical protein